MVVNHKRIAYSCVVSLVFAVTLSSATTDEKLVESIVALRGDVERLYTEVKENKERYYSQMKSLSLQTIDLQSQINRKETALKLLKSDLEKIQEKIKASSEGDKAIRPLVLDGIMQLKKAIKEGIPFMVAERIASLQKIESDLKKHLITNEKALALTWASYDDTIRITKEIGLFKQKITLGGKEILAKVAKLGSVALYFETPKGVVGYVQKREDGYNYKKITDPKDKEKILALFDALKKQIKTGFFELPNALVLQGSN